MCFEKQEKGFSKSLTHTNRMDRITEFFTAEYTQMIPFVWGSLSSSALISSSEARIGIQHGSALC